MSSLNQVHERVAQHYNQDAGFEFESVRLPQHCPVEFAITARHLNRWIPNEATIADVGVGVGHYAELLAKRGCFIHLVDISQRLLDTAYTRLKKQKLHQQVVETHLASATELNCLETGAMDVVLLLGPLYHLCSVEARQRAVDEASRVLQPNGILFAAGINRLAYFRDLLRTTPQLASSRKDFHKQLLQDGNVDPLHASPLGYGHLTTHEEFCKLFDAKFHQVVLTGVESFAAPHQALLTDLAPMEMDAWLDIVEATGSTLEGLGMADHFLYVGRKKSITSESVTYFYSGR